MPSVLSQKQATFCRGGAGVPARRDRHGGLPHHGIVFVRHYTSRFPVRMLIVFLTGAALVVAGAQAQTTWHVDDDAPLGGDGLTWDTAFQFLQDALWVASAGDEVHVAGGTSQPDQDEAGNVTPGDREATFQLVNGVALYGGYAGWADPGNPDDRDIQRYETTLSGDLAGNDQPDFENYDENCYHVVTGSGTDATTVLDGFTITAGNASTWYGRAIASSGGGVLLTDADLSVGNCLIKKNMADNGGGLTCDSSQLALTGCNFAENYASGLVETSYGGGMASFDSAVTLTNCTFTANWVGWMGGGGLCQVGGEVTLLDCVLTQNGGYCGGAILISDHFSETTCTLSSSTVTANLASEGGGVCCENASPTLTNCILWGDSPDEICLYSGSPVITHCDIEGGWPGEGNIDSDPLFADPNDADYRLRSGSPCIDAGDTTALPAGLFVDLDGQGRVLDDICTPDTGVPAALMPVTVDMGAYEYKLRGDLDGDGDVDLSDLAALLAVYGTTCE